MPSNLAFDVIVVGAGPGGLSCASQLASSGFSILVLEKNADVGRKICSGEISSKVLPGVEFKGAQEWAAVVVGTERCKTTVQYSRPFLKTVGRYELESYLKGKCDNRTEVHFSEPVLNIGPDYVITSKGKYAYRYLVGADGSFSKVREFLGLPTEHVVGWAYHYLVDKPAEEFRVYWLPRIFPRGYGYLMSKSRGQTMIGGAMAGGEIHKKLAPRVKGWVAKEFGIDVKSIKSEGMKGNADYRGWKFSSNAGDSGNSENVFLVGDAAGLLNPVTTEGIYYAVKSGEGVAKFIRGQKDEKTLRESVQIMQKLELTHRAQVFLFDIFTAWPMCSFVEWVLENPKAIVRKQIFDFVFWKFMDS